MHSFTEIGGLDIVLQRQIQELVFKIGKKSNCLESCLAAAQLDRLLQNLKLLKIRGDNRFSAGKRGEKISLLLSNQVISRLFGCGKRSYILKKIIGKSLSSYAIQGIRKFPNLNRIEILKKLCRFPIEKQNCIIVEIQNNPENIYDILKNYKLIQKKNPAVYSPIQAPHGKKAVFVDEDILRMAEENYSPGMLPVPQDIEHYLFSKVVEIKRQKLQNSKKSNDVLLSMENYY